MNCKTELERLKQYLFSRDDILKMTIMETLYNKRELLVKTIYDIDISFEGSFSHNPAIDEGNTVYRQEFGGQVVNVFRRQQI